MYRFHGEFDWRKNSTLALQIITVFKFRYRLHYLGEISAQTKTQGRIFQIRFEADVFEKFSFCDGQCEWRVGLPLWDRRNLIQWFFFFYLGLKNKVDALSYGNFKSSNYFPRGQVE